MSREAPSLDELYGVGAEEADGIAAASDAIDWPAVRAYLRASRDLRAAHGAGRCLDMKVFTRSHGRMTMAASMRLEEQWMAARVAQRFGYFASALLAMVWDSASITDYCIQIALAKRKGDSNVSC